MYIRVLALFVLAFLVCVSPNWAQSNCGGDFPTPCSITQSFSPAAGGNIGIYDFTDGSRGSSNDGYLVVQFDTVLTSFSLTVTLDFTTNSVLALELDPTEFPTGTVCVQYPSQDPSHCIQYDITGTASSPSGLPVKNVDYQGLISLTLSYFTVNGFLVQTPAFGHAPGDTNPPEFTVNILDAYSDDTTCPTCGDPTMHGKIPTPSSLIALNEPLTSSSSKACSLTVSPPTNVPSGQKPQVEVTLAEASACPGAGVRDKTARLSVSTFDLTGNFSFPPLKNVEGNKFHWDAKNGLNEYDISTDGLVSGQSYTVTVFSSQVAPISATFAAP